MKRFIACLLLICIPIGIRAHNEDTKRLVAEEESQAMNELVLTPARVVAKRIQHGYAGSSKMPQYATGFIVTFLSEDDETLEFSVSEEMFESLQEQQTGMLVTSDGNFFDFGDGEDVVDIE